MTMMEVMETETTDAGATTERWEIFERSRGRLHGIALRIVGSADDADDVVQEASLRWLRADVASVRAPEGWLVTVVTRLAIARVRRAASELQTYRHAADLGLHGPSDWGGLDSAAEVAAQLSEAFHALRERLAPIERTALVLREAFACGYDEIARVLDKSEAACRQIVHRARERVRRPLQRVASRLDDPSELAERFVGALAREDREAVLAALHHEELAVAGRIDRAMCAAA